MGVTLERVQNKFACIIGELCNEPVILSQFAIWVDMRIAEYKAKGTILLDCSGQSPDPTWLKGHSPGLSNSEESEMTQGLSHLMESEMTQGLSHSLESEMRQGLSHSMESEMPPSVESQRIQNLPHSMGGADFCGQIKTENNFCSDARVVVKKEPLENEELADFSGQFGEVVNDSIATETGTLDSDQRSNDAVHSFQLTNTHYPSLQMGSTDSSTRSAHLSCTNSKTVVEKRVSCDLCGSKFNTRKLMLRHKNRVHTELSLRCSWCGKMFKRPDKLKDHEKSHEKRDLKIQSLLCQANSTNTHVLDRLRARQCQRLIVDKRVSCDLCGSKFSTRILMKRHKKRVHTEASLSCSRCDKMFKRRDKLRDHEKSHSRKELKMQSLLHQASSANTRVLDRLRAKLST